jgi:hypothetical protein
MKYKVGDLFLSSHGGTGILFELGEKSSLGIEKIFIYWTDKSAFNRSIQYNQYEISTNIGQGRWKHVPVCCQ